MIPGTHFFAFFTSISASTIESNDYDSDAEMLLQQEKRVKQEYKTCKEVGPKDQDGVLLF